MKRRRNVHQWRDWLLDYVGEDEYELIQKDTRAVHTIVAKNAMDAENECRKIIQSTKEEKLKAP
jgi:hypothetical protein